MNDMYKSGFASSIEDMINLKTALGHKMNSYKWYLSNFDCFCQKHFPNENILTSEVTKIIKSLLKKCYKRKIKKWLPISYYQRIW